MKGRLRYATPEDMDLLYNWRNDPSVRKNSFSSEEIPYEDHKKWFDKLLSRADAKQYIYVYDNENIGQARIEADGTSALISYSISSSRQGLGHGKNLLYLLYNQVQTDFPDVKTLIGKVKPDNIASQKAFLDTGYKENYKAFTIDVNGPAEFTEHVKTRGGGYCT